MVEPATIKAMELMEKAARDNARAAAPAVSAQAHEAFVRSAWVFESFLSGQLRTHSCSSANLRLFVQLLVVVLVRTWQSSTRDACSARVVARVQYSASTLSMKTRPIGWMLVAQRGRSAAARRCSTRWWPGATGRTISRAPRRSSSSPLRWCTPLR